MDNPAPEIPYKEKTDPFSSHSLIINRIKNLDPGTRILDVGTAGGTIGRRLKDKGLIVNGIEPIAAWADVAIPFYDALIAVLRPLRAISPDIAVKPLIELICQCTLSW